MSAPWANPASTVVSHPPTAMVAAAITPASIEETAMERRDIGRM
jgi:hypothetical protein